MISPTSSGACSKSSANAARPRSGSAAVDSSSMSPAGSTGREPSTSAAWATPVNPRRARTPVSVILRAAMAPPGRRAPVPRWSAPSLVEGGAGAGGDLGRRHGPGSLARIRRARRDVNGLSRLDHRPPLDPRGRLAGMFSPPITLSVATGTVQRSKCHLRETAKDE